MPLFVFLSLEPLLGPIDLTSSKGFGKIKWAIVGGESGANARPMGENWVRSLRDQCVAKKVAFFYKQLIDGGVKVSLPPLDGMIWTEYPKI